VVVEKPGRRLLAKGAQLYRAYRRACADLRQLLGQQRSDAPRKVAHRQEGRRAGGPFLVLAIEALLRFMGMGSARCSRSRRPGRPRLSQRGRSRPRRRHTGGADTLD
jgi:hypothetical protein